MSFLDGFQGNLKGASTVEKYELILETERFLFRNMVDKISSLYYSALPEGHVFQMEEVKGLIRSKIFNGIDEGAITKGVVGNNAIMYTPEGSEEYFDVDIDASSLDTIQVRDYLRNLVLSRKMVAPLEFKKYFLGIAIEQEPDVYVKPIALEPSKKLISTEESKRYCFTKTTQSWQIIFGDEILSGLKDRVGMSYIQLLLQSPREEMGVIKLQAMTNPSSIGHSGNSEYLDMINNAEEQDTNYSQCKTDGKKTSLQVYYNKLKKIQEERNSLKDYDYSDIERLDNETNAIENAILEIQYAKNEDPEIERNRKNVFKSITDALKNIKSQEEKAGYDSTPIYSHLKNYIKTGTNCKYDPPVESKANWTF